MTDQLAGWLQVLLAVVSILLTISGVAPIRRRHWRRVRYSHWKVWGIEHTRLESTDDSQS